MTTPVPSLDAPSPVARGLVAAAVAGRLIALFGPHLAVAAALRLIWLARPDPFGAPLVGKVDWYWFHAVAYDTQQAAVVALPLAALSALAVVIAAPRRRTSIAQIGGRVAQALCAALTTIGLVDNEAMRFAGSHISSTLLQTYVNPASLVELPQLVASDDGGPFLPWLLLPLSLVVQARWQSALLRSNGAEQGSRWRQARVFVVAALAIGASWLLTEVLWTGKLRTWRLQPPLSLLAGELRRGADRPELSAAERTAAIAAARARWQAAWPAVPAIFPLMDQPLLAMTPHRTCRAVAAGHLPAPQGLRCDLDADGDGVPLARDCSDTDASVAPGRPDQPGDGVDQDCNGVDEEPWNVLVLALESHRGVALRHVVPAPPASGGSWSPALDRLAAQGLCHRRAVANGLPTIATFMALHTGLPPAPGTEVAVEFSGRRLPSLPDVLRRHGYHTRFFSAPDPGWDNQSAWLRRWYDAVDYHRSREDDAPFLRHLGQWLRRDWPQEAQRSGKRAFFVMAMTRTNHFPFHRIEGVPRTGDESWPARMKDTMTYTDQAVDALLRELAAEPWISRTVVIITGDHGYPLGEHGSRKLYESVHIESTGVPLVLLGDHPKLAGLAGICSDAPVSHIDIAPTVLDLAGVDLSGPWAGRSLLRPGQLPSFTYQMAQWALEDPQLRLLVPSDAASDPRRWLLYGRGDDPLEQRPLPIAGPQAERAQAMAATLRQHGQLLDALYRGDGWLPSWW